VQEGSKCAEVGRLRRMVEKGSAPFEGGMVGHEGAACAAVATNTGKPVPRGACSAGNTMGTVMWVRRVCRW